MTEAAYSVKRTRIGTYEVFNAAGVRVSSGHGEKLVAERLADKLAARDQRQPRPCMTCGTSFMSDGAHNRMCNPCRKHAADGDWLGADALTIQPKAGRAS